MDPFEEAAAEAEELAAEIAWLSKSDPLMAAVLEVQEALMAGLLTQRQRLASQAAEIASLRQQLAQVQTLKYVGVWEKNREYEPGHVTTDGGSMWVCRSKTMTRPGEEESAWTLAVKRGKDGKDGRDAARHSTSHQPRTAR